VQIRAAFHAGFSPAGLRTRSAFPQLSASMTGFVHMVYYQLTAPHPITKKSIKKPGHGDGRAGSTRGVERYSYFKAKPTSSKPYQSCTPGRTANDGSKSFFDLRLNIQCAANPSDSSFPYIPYAYHPRFSGTGVNGGGASLPARCLAAMGGSAKALKWVSLTGENGLHHNINCKSINHTNAESRISCAFNL